MLNLVYVVLVGFAPAEFIGADVVLKKGESWSHSFILAPGDSLRANAVLRQKVGSSCGALAALGDIFCKKGDNVGRIAVDEWEGNTVASVWEQVSPSLSCVSERGGAYTLTVENHSGHRTNLYSVRAARVPVSKRYVGFVPEFVADTAFDTTWTTEVRQRLLREEITKDTTWEENAESTLVSVDTLTDDVLDEVKHVPSQSTELVQFEIPSDAERWAYWVGVEEAYSALKRLLGPAAQAAGYALGGPVAAYAAGAISDLAGQSNTSNIDVGYTLDQMNDYGYTRIVNGGRVKASYRKMPCSGYRHYSFHLDNSYSVLTPKSVHVKVVSVKTVKNYSVEVSNLPVVTTRKVPIYQDYEVKVPHVTYRVTPVQTWLKCRQ